MIIIGGGAVLTRDPEKPFMAGGGVALIGMVTTG